MIERGAADPGRARSDFKLVDGAELLGKSFPPIQFIVTSMIPKRSLCMIAGDSGVGKTILGMNLAICVATGEPFLGFPIMTTGSVLYIDNELGEEAIGRRIGQMNRRIDRGMIQFLPSAPRIIDIQEEIYQHCNKANPALIVIDSLYLAQTGREKEESDMRSFLSWVKGLSEDHETSVILVHHFRKGAKKERGDLDQITGSGAIGRILDTAVGLRRSDTDPSKRILKILKGRHCEDSLVGRAFQLSLSDWDLWFHNEGEVCEDDHIHELVSRPGRSKKVRALLDRFKGTPFTRADALHSGMATGDSRATVDRSLRDGLESGKLVKLGHSQYRAADECEKSEGLGPSMDS